MKLETAQMLTWPGDLSNLTDVVMVHLDQPYTMLNKETKGVTAHYCTTHMWTHMGLTRPSERGCRVSSAKWAAAPIALSKPKGHHGR